MKSEKDKSVKSKILRLLLSPLRTFEQTKGRRRLLLILAYLFIGVSLWLGYVRMTTLIGLPDIGADFIESHKPTDEPQDYAGDAHLINSLVTEYPTRTPQLNSIRQALATGQWSQASPQAKSWLETHFSLVDRWRALVADRSFKENAYSYYLCQARINNNINGNYVIFNELTHGLELQASKLESEGKLRESWQWRMAYLRGELHEASMSRIGYMMIKMQSPINKANIAIWSKHPKMTVPLLKEALADVLKTKTEELSPVSWVHESLTNHETLLSKEKIVKDEQFRERAAILAFGKEFWDNPNYAVLRTPRFKLQAWMSNDPERSRRVIRLIHLNWLNELTQPSARIVSYTGQTPAYPIALVHSAQTDQSGFLADKLIERELVTWLFNSPYAQANILGDDLPKEWLLFLTLRDNEFGAIAVSIAEQIFLKEQGRLPKTLEALLDQSYLTKAHLPKNADPLLLLSAPEGSK